MRTHSGGATGPGGSAPADLRGNVLEDALDGVRVVVHTQLVRDSQEQRIGSGDGFVPGELFDQDVGLRGVRAAEDGAGGRVDVADLILVPSVAAEVGAVAVVDEREDAAANRHARFTPMPGLL